MTSPRRGTIVLVEDELLITLTITDWLEEAGYSVAAYPTADEAVAYLRSGGKCDFVFSDVRLPGSLDGFGFADWLEVHHPGVPLVLTSGHMLTGEVRGRAFLPKPYQLSKLLDHVSKALGQGRS